MLDTVDKFVTFYRQQNSFTYCKINHGFWEVLAKAHRLHGKLETEEDQLAADSLVNLPGFFSSGFASDLLDLLHTSAEEGDPALHMGLELSAWPNDNRIIGTPHEPYAETALAPVASAFSQLADGLLLKRAVMSSRINEIFALFADTAVLIIGPSPVASLKKIESLRHADYMPIHPSQARETRCEIERQITDWIQTVGIGTATTVLLQAGTLAPYWILRLRHKFPNTRWVDGGLAFSIMDPSDLLNRPWGQVYRKQILSTYNQLSPDEEMSVSAHLPQVSAALNKVANEYAQSNLLEETGKVAFIEKKPLYQDRISDLLETSQRFNRFANRGPLWTALSGAYQQYFYNLKRKKVVPCSNAGVGLQAVVSLLNIRHGKKRLRWCVSSFGWASTNRGNLSSAITVDCDPTGILSLDALTAVSTADYDGVIVTNPFGLHTEFSGFSELQASTGVPLIIDNAAGIRPDIPDLPYQIFSLHHTKPFGAGEGGLIVVPDEDYELVLSLLEYTPIPEQHLPHWVTNGKVSDLACAAHLARLEAEPEWRPLYTMQATRIINIAYSHGFKPLMAPSLPLMSIPLIAKNPVKKESLQNEHLTLGKYYKPLAVTPNCNELYKRLVNVPCHPDVAALSRDQIDSVFERLKN